MNRALRCINCFLALFAVVVASAAATDTIKIAHIDPLSGPFALIGESASRMIQASIDDVVLTGNWGPDLSLLIKAGREAGLDVVYYTLNSHNAGMAAAIGKSGADQIRQVFTWHANIADRTSPTTSWSGSPTTIASASTTISGSTCRNCRSTCWRRPSTARNPPIRSRSRRHCAA